MPSRIPSRWHDELAVSTEPTQRGFLAENEHLAVYSDDIHATILNRQRSLV